MSFQAQHGKIKACSSTEEGCEIVGVDEGRRGCNSTLQSKSNLETAPIIKSVLSLHAPRPS